MGQVRRELSFLKSSVDQLGQVIRPKTSTAHAHVVRIPGVHGGRPVVRGRRFDAVAAHEVGMAEASDDERWPTPQPKVAPS
jgi:hypothetical protein